jgi:F-type H+-transporting ATPase subunit alpha
VRRFEAEFYKFMETKYGEIEHTIENELELSDPIKQKLDKAISEFKNDFLKSIKDDPNPAADKKKNP